MVYYRTGAAARRRGIWGMFVDCVHAEMGALLDQHTHTHTNTHTKERERAYNKLLADTHRHADLVISDGWRWRGFLCLNKAGRGSTMPPLTPKSEQMCFNFYNQMLIDGERKLRGKEREQANRKQKRFGNANLRGAPLANSWVRNSLC